MALLAHLAERHHEADLAEVERLGHLLRVVCLSTAHRALFEMPDILRALETSMRRHAAETAAALFPHIIALELEPNARRLTLTEVARLIHRLRSDHATVDGLLDALSRRTNGYVVPAGAPPSLRELYAGLAEWERSAREHAHLENHVLVARVLALDPSIERDVTPVALPTHSRGVLSADGRREKIAVFCPAERRSFDLAWCSGCPFMRRVSQVFVECTPHVDRPTLVEGVWRRGETSAVGEVMGECYVTAGPGVLAGVAAHAIEDAHVQAAVVVDDDDRLVGTVLREDARTAVADRPVSELVEEAPFIHESVSLADAIARMVKAHRRFLPVLGSDGRVVGLLSDTDALRWVAAHNEGLRAVTVAMRVLTRRRLAQAPRASRP